MSQHDPMQQSPKPGVPSLPSDLTHKLRQLRDALGADLVERDVAIRLALLAALAGEHLLLLGPPGTAKSLVARRLHRAFADALYFERLLTRFTVPEELFGPLSIKGLEEDRYERLTDAYLPNAGIAFLDEIFKANSAILNALLTLLNEREFDNGKVRVKTPLVAVIGASNELPREDELDALYDRFLLRLHVGPVSQDGFPALLKLRGDAAPTIPEGLRLSREELTTIQTTAVQAAVNDDVLALLGDLRNWCTAENIPVSDRRWRKIVKLLQVSAVTNGRDAVSVWDCWLLQHCLWNTPESREKVYEWYAARVGASAAMDPAHLTSIVVSYEARLKSDRESRTQRRDDKGNHLYMDSRGTLTINTQGTAQRTRGNEPLFLAPSNAASDMYGHHPIAERSNSDKGYIREDLNKLYVYDNHHRRVQFVHWNGRDTYLADENNWLMEKVKLAPAVQPTEFSPYYIDAQLTALQNIRDNVAAYQAMLETHIGTLETEIRSHLWVTPQFAVPAAANLAETRRTVELLEQRLTNLADGFSRLPQEKTTTAAGAAVSPSATKKRGT